jgi:hypothetical protein
VTAGDACVREEGDWVAVEARAPGTVRVEAELSAGGIADALTGAAETCSG